MSTTVQPIPEGFHSLTPAVNVIGCAEAIDFYRRVFGAVERYRLPGPDGGIMHAEITIGNSILMLADENPQWGNRSAKTIGGTPISLCLYVPDCDAVFNTAVAAGATIESPVSDQFWGDRSGCIVDPFGLKWMILTHTEDLTPAEIGQRGAEFMAKMCASGEAAS